MTKELAGEALGTFIIVLIGCGTLALEVLYGTFGHIIPIALMWGAGVALAIYSSWKICPAHLNPAVSLAMFINKEISMKQLLGYWTAQFSGAFIAAVTLYLGFKNSINSFEPIKSISSAKMFGEYYSLNTSMSFALEMIGTAFLVFMIFIIVNKVKRKAVVPILIGGVVTVAIIFIAPYTQCGINPARDFAPRLLSYLTEWESVAFSQSSICVYVAAPLLGSIVGYLGFYPIKKASNSRGSS